MKHSTEDLVNAVAKELATWWRLRTQPDTHKLYGLSWKKIVAKPTKIDFYRTVLLWEAFEALEYLYPTGDADDWPGFWQYERMPQND